jgi:hypothetical protein
MLLRVSIRPGVGLEIMAALGRGDFNRFGELLDAHWQNKSAA